MKVAITLENLNSSVLISIIVLIYKVEPYIRQCIDSLINQAFKDFEIILVDDGSPDSCPEICDEYTAKDSRIKVIHKENGGVVSARKAGLAAAAGEYITFVDGDDWIGERFIEQQAEIIEKYSPDILTVTACYFSTEGNDELRDICNGYRGLYGREQLEKEVFNKTVYTPPFFSFGISPCVWNKFIRRELLLRFLPNEPENIRMGEDLAVSMPCILMADTAYFSDACGYYYRQNPTSITHTFDPTAPERVVSLIETLERETEQYGNKYGIKDQIAVYAVYITEGTLISLIQGSQDIKNDLGKFNVLWENSSFKKGLKFKIPFRERLLLAIAKSNQPWLIRLIRRIKYGKEDNCA